MTRTQYFTATSIDGYIADQDNSLGWLTEITPRDDRFGPFFADVGAFAMGATSYEWIIEHEQVLDEPQKWRAWYGDTPSWVFTHRGDLPVVPGAPITLVSGDVRPVHEAMVAAAQGRNIWLVGGGELVGTFADHGLLDEIIVGVAPVMLGGGAPLLPRRLLSSELRLTSVEPSGAFAYLTYEVRPKPSSDSNR